MKVNTVLGPIESDQLGFTLMHEHIIIANHTLRRAYPAWFDHDVFMEYVLHLCRNAKEAGIDTITEATPIDLGRDLELMQEVSEKSGLNIIPCTGFYWNFQVSLGDKSPEFIAQILIDDLTKGMDGTSYKAQFIKWATVGPELSDYDRKIGTATAIAAKETGAMIYTHTNNKNGLSQVDFFEEQGVDLSHVVIGHMGDTEDLDYIRSVLNRGVRIGSDRISACHLEPEFYMADEKRARVIGQLAKEGYLGRIVLSHDVCGYLDYSGYQDRWNPFTENMSRDLNTFTHQWRYIPTTFYPMLREAGIDEGGIRQLMVENPRAIFEGR